MRRVMAALASGLAAAVALAGCGFESIYSLPLPGGPATPNAYTVTVEFSDVTNLVPHSAVKVNNVAVGSVRKIELAGRNADWHARATLVLKGDVRLPDNATAAITQTSLLGAKFVALSPPVAAPARGRLSDGDVIPLSRTGRFPEVETVLTALSLLLNRGGLAQLETITSELNAALGGNEQAIRDLLKELETFVGGLEEQKAQIVRALEGLDRLTTRLAEQKEILADAVDRIEPALEVLNRQQEDLTKTLVALSDLGKVATRVINQSREDLLATLRNLKPILDRLAAAGSDLPEALGFLVNYPFPQTSARGIAGDYVNLTVTAELSMRVLIHNLAGGSDLSGGLPLGSVPGSLAGSSGGRAATPPSPAAPSPSGSPRSSRDEGGGPVPRQEPPGQGGGNADSPPQQGPQGGSGGGSQDDGLLDLLGGSE